MISMLLLCIGWAINSDMREPDGHTKIIRSYNHISRGKNRFMKKLKNTKGNIVRSNQLQVN